MMKLTIELVPATLWGVNPRNILPKEDWDRLRKATYKKAGYRCEICGGRGATHPIECHESWEYIEDGENSVQKLLGLVGLCPDCHSVKHMGLTGAKGNAPEAIQHFMKVNACSNLDFDSHLYETNRIYFRRIKLTWAVDFTVLKDMGIVCDKYIYTAYDIVNTPISEDKFWTMEREKIKQERNNN